MIFTLKTLAQIADPHRPKDAAICLPGHTTGTACLLGCPSVTSQPCLTFGCPQAGMRIRSQLSLARRGATLIPVIQSSRCLATQSEPYDTVIIGGGAFGSSWSRHIFESHGVLRSCGLCRSNQVCPAWSQGRPRSWRVDAHDLINTPRPFVLRREVLSVEHV